MELDKEVPLHLEIKNGDPDQYILRGNTCNIITLNASLDYVLSDILSFSPIPTMKTVNGHEVIDGGFFIDTEKDAGYRAALRDSYDYKKLQELACDDGKRGFSSLGLLQDIQEFMDICKMEPRYMTFESFEAFLAIRQIDIPHGHTVVLFKEGKNIDSHECYHDWCELYGAHLPEKNCLAIFEEKRNHFDLRTTYEIWGYADLALAILYLLLKSGQALKCCVWCGMWFSPSRSSEQYCMRTAPGEEYRTCKEAAKYDKQLKRERASESGKIYKSVSTMLAAKADYAKGEDAVAKRAFLEDFRDQAKEWRTLIKRGEKTEAEYIAFLNSFKKRKPRQ